MAKVSVIIPVYNVEKYIRECLDSVINQTLTDIEIICVDDGSTDDSLAILEEYASRDNRIKIFTKSNGGASSARNMALCQATGKYIYFIDSDDYINFDTLETLYKVSNNNGLDITFFGALCFTCDEETNTKNIYEQKYYIRDVCLNEIFIGKDLYRDLVLKKRFNVTVVSQFINREFLVKSCVRFYEGIMYEDELFSAQILLKANKVMIIPENFYMRRVRENSVMTTKISTKNVDSIVTVFNELMKEYVYANYDLKYKDAIILHADRIYGVIQMCYRVISKEEKKQTLKIDSNLLNCFIDVYRKDCRSRIKSKGKYKYFIDKLNGGVQCCKEHGIIYTFMWTFEKIKKFLAINR